MKMTSVGETKMSLRRRAVEALDADRREHTERLRESAYAWVVSTLQAEPRRVVAAHDVSSVLAFLEDDITILIDTDYSYKTARVVSRTTRGGVLLSGRFSTLEGLGRELLTDPTLLHGDGLEQARRDAIKLLEEIGEK